MAKYIDAEKVIAALTDTLQYEGMVMDELISVVANIPAADVESAIHCRDCRWGRSHNFDGTRICEYHDDMAKHDDDYCSRAERREDD